jgi:hypothetical protein
MLRLVQIVQRELLNTTLGQSGFTFPWRQGEQNMHSNTEEIVTFPQRHKKSVMMVDKKGTMTVDQ